LRGCSSVHLASIANFHNKDAQSAVLVAADNSIVANTVLPELAQLGAFEGFSNAPRVVQYGHTLAQKFRG
jgi:hypothetical protein